MRGYVTVVKVSCLKGGQSALCTPPFGTLPWDLRKWNHPTSDCSIHQKLLGQAFIQVFTLRCHFQKVRWGYFSLRMCFSFFFPTVMMTAQTLLRQRANVQHSDIFSLWSRGYVCCSLAYHSCKVVLDKGKISLQQSGNRTTREGHKKSLLMFNARLTFPLLRCLWQLWGETPIYTLPQINTSLLTFNIHFYFFL